MRTNSRRLVCLLSTCTLAALAGCTPSANDEVLLLTTRETVNLFEHLPEAHAYLDDGLIGSIPLDDLHYFSGEWHDAQSEKNGEPFRWLGRGTGAIDVSLATFGRLVVEVEFSPPEGDKIPPLTVQGMWNGHDLGGASIKDVDQGFTFEIRPGIQRIGPNRLELAPAFWLDESMLNPGSPRRDISVRLSKLSIIRPRDAGRNILPPLAIELRDEALIQHRNSTLTFYRLLGANPILHVSGEVLTAEGLNLRSASGKIRIAVTDAKGESDILYESALKSLHDSSEIDLDLDLAAYSDQFIALTFAFSLAGDGEVARSADLAWNNLELSDDQQSLRDPPESTTTERPNIMVVLFDTLRADHTEPYGATNVSTPNMLRLADEGTTFSNATSQTSWTRSSVATLMTGTYETRHGTGTPEDRLGDTLPYLPELLRNQGYRTSYTIFNGHISSSWGFARGYDEPNDQWPILKNYLTPGSSPEEFLDRVWEPHVAPFVSQSDDPFFVYLHFLDPHGPYTPQPPFDSMYPTPYRGKPDLMRTELSLVRKGLISLDDADLAFFDANYRGEISFMDGVLGAILDHLEEQNLRDNTLILFVSDHGDEFGEHGGFSHGVNIYDEVLRVPFIWSWKGHIPQGTKVAANVGLVDTMPTILKLLNLDVPSTTQGRDLGPFFENQTIRGPMHPLYASKLGKRWGGKLQYQAIRLGHWKLIERIFHEIPHFELFNIRDDPGEVYNQWTGQAIVGRALESMLNRHLTHEAATAFEPPEHVPMDQIDELLVEQLENLGYLN